ncbi:hypothetical protein BaRGS_00033850 [Batillaria attramentaria]|uniref:Methyltransferase HEMK2 n=1 Tax=Batillaria attramentaria TaxID=370345 RepID=A0ABD0JJS8_9CAEN
MKGAQPTFSTPDLSHIKSADYEHVYEPAEDSFLMLDALESEYAFLNQLQPSICVEVGSGSGVCITFLAQCLGPSAFYMCTDLNPAAARLSQATGRQNNVLVQPVTCDLTSALEHRLKGQIDVLLFNPPYVVTPSSEVGSRGIEASWAGGEKGREVTDRFLPSVSHLLSSKDEIEDMMMTAGFQMTVVNTRKAGREHLSVLKFTRVT